MQYEIDIEALEIKKEIIKNIDNYLEIKYSSKVIKKQNMNKVETLENLKKLVNKLEKLNFKKGKKIWIKK